MCCHLTICFLIIPDCENNRAPAAGSATAAAEHRFAGENNAANAIADTGDSVAANVAGVARVTDVADAADIGSDTNCEDRWTSYNGESTGFCRSPPLLVKRS